MYLKENIWRDCQLEKFIMSRNNHNPMKDYGEPSANLVERITTKNGIEFKHSLLNFKIRLNLYNDFLLGCDIVDFGVNSANK